MIKILFAAVIIGAFYSLIAHIVSNGDKEKTVNKTVNGAIHMVVKILIPLIVILVAVIGLLYITGWVNWVL